MPNEWEHSMLGHLCTFVAGSAFPKDYQGESMGTYPFIKVSDMNLPGNERWINNANNWISEEVMYKLRAKIHPDNATIFAKIGIALTYNRRRLLPQPTVIDNNLMSAVPDTNLVDPLFFYYLLSTLDFNRIVCGTALPYLNVGDLQRIPVIIPPLREQKAIACILGALDDKIELNRRMNQTLEAIARAIFKSWFVDFDPVRFKAAGQQPLALAPHIADLFPDSFEESKPMQIPQGWDMCTINDVADLNVRTLGKNDEQEVIDYIEISKVMRGEVSEITRYERGTEPSRARRRLTHGDTVLSTVRPDRGAYFLCLNPSDTLIASTGFVIATPKNASWAFLHAALTRPEVGDELGRLADGGAYPAVRPEVIGGLPLVVPRDRQIIDVFERVAQPLFAKAGLNRVASLSLITIRDVLLPRLISGELRIPDAERIVERRL